MDFANADQRTLERALRSPMLGEAAKDRVRSRLAELGEPVGAPLAAGRENGKALKHSGAGSGKSTGAAPAPLAGPEGLRLTLYGPPRTKKNHGTRLKIGDRVKTIPSEAWRAWRDALLATGQLPAAAVLPDLPYNCAATFFRDRDTGDLVGFQQGLADVLEEGGVLSDDKWIRGWDGSRLEVDRACPRVEIALTPLNGNVLG